jgi:hypothetical protein
MYGAIAGISIKDEMKLFAVKKGLLVIKPKGHSVIINNNKDFKPCEWAVK